MSGKLRPVTLGQPQHPMPVLPLGLDGEVARAKVQANHASLARALTRAINDPPIEFRATFAEPKATGYRTGRLIAADGRVVAVNAREWMMQRIESACHDLHALACELDHTSMQRTHRLVRRVYLSARVGAGAGDQIQARVDVVEEVIGPAVTSLWPSEQEIVDPCPLWPGSEHEYAPFAPAHYQLIDVMDLRPFVERSSELRRRRFYETLDLAASRHVTEINAYTGERRAYPLIDHPQFPKTPPACRLHRLFEDWDTSSAGAVARIEQHWALKLGYGVWPEGEFCDAIPCWTRHAKLPTLAKARVRSPRELLAWLYRFDDRAGYPFAWFFYAVHGNLIDDSAIERVEKMLASDPDVLPARDAAVVRRWSQAPYGF